MSDITNQATVVGCWTRLIKLMIGALLLVVIYSGNEITNGDPKILE